MNDAELTTFITVAHTESTSAAAIQLHISQPAVTRRVQTLEAALQIPLFDRVGKRLQLNQAGRLFLPQAQEMLTIWQRSQTQLQDLAEIVGGSLNLATSHHIGLHRLAPVLESYRNKFADVQLNISFEDSEVTHELVADGKIDLAVATLDPSGGGHALHTQAIWHDPLVFVAKSHATLTLKDLANQPCVLPGTATYTGRIVLERFRAAGVHLNPEMSTNYLETIHMLVGVGVGWSVLPLSMRGELKEIDIKDFGAPMFRTLGAVTHPQRELSNAASAFVDVLEDYATV